jgi:LCP family protein required for cell wall assembly
MAEAPAAALPSPQRRSEGIAARRGTVLVLMSLLVPGSAQLAAGNRRLGRIALRVWLSLILLLLLAGVLALVARPLLIGLYTNPFTLLALQVAAIVLGVGWVLLLVDAWRIANPGAMSLAGRLLTGLLTLALVAGTGGVAWSASSSFGTQAHFIETVFGGGGTTQATNGRFNILLMGGDAGKSRDGLRPDSLTVASIDAETGRTVLLSLPRNLQWAPFPADNPLHAKYPNGYWCATQECLLNAVYTLAEDNRKLFPKVKYPGAEATADVVGEILGIDINYWAMIDLSGFKQLIDAVGGIRLDITKRVPMGITYDDKGVFDWIEPGKNVLLDGYHALWFARSRTYSSDYERMARQKCVMNAMLRQLNPTTVLTKFNELASASEKVIATNIPGGEINTMLELAMKAKALPMGSVSFTPPLIKPVKPDFAKIRQVVADRIATSEALDNPQPDSSTSTSTTPKPRKSSSTQTSDLDAVCSVSG